MGIVSNTNLTKKELAESLKRLASERLFEHITVGDIVKECGVNRQTFYYHFTDKYELLDWIYNNETFHVYLRDAPVFTGGICRQ